MKKQKGTKRKTAGKPRSYRLLYFIVLVLAFAGSAGGSYIYFKGMFAVDSPFLQDIQSRQSAAEERARKSSDGRLYDSAGEETAPGHQDLHFLHLPIQGLRSLK